LTLLDPDPYIVTVLDPDPYIEYTDPQHCFILAKISIYSAYLNNLLLTLLIFVVDKTVLDLDPELGSLMWIQIRGSHSYADTDTDPQHGNIHEVLDLLGVSLSVPVSVLVYR